MLTFVLNPECVPEEHRARLLMTGAVVFPANLTYNSDSKFSERDAGILIQCDCVYDPRREDTSGAWQRFVIEAAHKLGLRILWTIEEVEEFARQKHSARMGMN